VGARGPRPEPPELKLLKGGRDHRPLDITTLFRPEVAAPSAPSWLLPEARKAWRRLAPELLRYNLLSLVDRDAFAMLCQTIGRLEMIERSLRGRQMLAESAGRDQLDALLDTTPNGLRVQSAAYQILNREQQKLHRLLEGFGLRPDARAKVTAGIRAQLQLFPVDSGASAAADADTKPLAAGWDSF
jgi:P27 family predicted phage terminase small subunit